MKFKHYIITRFNFGIYDRKDAGEWMEYRIGLFEQYTLPSIKAQTNKNFTWVLCFDERTPGKIICKYDYLDNVEIFYGRGKDWIKQKPAETDWIITSRIDNDDFYHKDFVQNIQMEFLGRGMKEMILDVHYYIMDHNTKELWDLERPLPNSPLITLCEWWQGAESVLAHEHSNMTKYYRGYIIPKYLACQVAHGKNVICHCRGKKKDHNLQGWL